MTTKLTYDRAAVVDTIYHWREIDQHTPRGVKLQLINRKMGVAQYSVLQANNEWYTHWAPLPTFRKETK
jgi:hypothetical protein